MSFLTSRMLSMSSRRTLLKMSTTTPSTTTVSQPQRNQSRYAMPTEAWDCHMHVTDLAKFPSKKGGNTEYQAHSTTLEDASANGARLGLPNLAFTQVSTYGQDNSCLLDCVNQLGESRARGVVDFDPATTPEATLKAWHAAGIRGVRVNYKSVGARPSVEEIQEKMDALDWATHNLGGQWAIHVHATLDLIPALSDATTDLCSSICIDHMGSPPVDFDPDALVESDDWHALLGMLECGTGNGGEVFVKISAPYRFLKDPADWHKFEKPVKQLLAARGGDAAVFASDWPHTRFEGTDIMPWRDLCLEWCGDNEELRNKLFRDNAHELYDIWVD